ncbi:hypothetical protein ACM0K4_03010 [Mycoplasma sp. VS42A]|uniref:hypothetical protein n=1 Tax=unclassified Mycoplasma TaxID=2683645 RepID=UPI003A891F08
MTINWLYIIVIILAALLFYAAFKMYGYFNFIKAGFNIAWVRTQTFWKLGLASAYFGLIIILFALYASGVLKITIWDKTAYVPYAFSPIGAFALISYFALVFYIAIVVFSLIVLLSKKERITITWQDVCDLDVDSFNLNIDKTYIKNRNSYTMFKDYITNSMMFKKHPKIFASKVIYYALMFIYSSPVYENAFKKQVDQNEETVEENEFDKLLVSERPIAELFSDNKQYITYVIKTAYQKVNTFYPLDEISFKNAVIKAFK